MATMSIYKPGQGYWTRVLTAVGAGVLTLGAAAELYKQLSGVVTLNFYIRLAVPIALIFVVGAVVYWALNKPRVVDFMIATEAEMRKVNWPTRREIIGSTIVVICGTLMLSVMLLVIDVGFAYFFQKIGVLEGTN